MRTRLFGIGMLAVATSAGLASAATVDGALGVGEYGTALATQLNHTSFGNASATSGGSELDAAYGSISGGSLNLLLTGNLETNFNKLVIVIDNGSGVGQNQLVNEATGNGEMDRLGASTAGGTDGLKFDTGFTASHVLFVNAGGTPTTGYANFDSLSATGAADGFLGSFTPGSVPTTLSNGIQIAFDNSNILGVDGSLDPTSTATALTATTGTELAIPLSVLGNPTGAIRVTAFINGSGNDYISNQVLGSLPLGSNNLQDPRTVDLSALAGNQYFTVTPAPEPASLAVLGLGAVGLLRRRK